MFFTFVVYSTIELKTFLPFIGTKIKPHTLLSKNKVGAFSFLMFINIPHKIINECNENGTLKQLAVFYFLKKLHTNSCIFKYTIHRLHKKSGISRTAIERYINIFIRNGWCTMHHDNLVFGKHKGKKFARLDTKHTIKHILTQLQRIIFKTKENQIKFLIKKRTDFINPKTLKEYRAAIKYFGRSEKFSSEMSDKIRMSIFCIAEMYHCSISKASGIVKKLSNEGFLSVMKNKELLFSGVSPKFFKSIQNQLEGYCYYHKGNVVRLRCSTYGIF